MDIGSVRSGTIQPGHQQVDIGSPPPRSTDLQIARNPQSRRGVEKSIRQEYGAAALNYAKGKLKEHERGLGFRLSVQGAKQFLTTQAKTARDSAMGLSGLRREDNAFDLGQTVGKSTYEKGGKVGQLGTFTTVKQKDVGRDPGQLAKLGWTPQDQANLRDGSHPYGQARANLLPAFNRGDQQATTALLDALKEKENDPVFKTRMDRAWNEHFTATGQHPTRQDLMPKVYNSLPQAEKRAFVDLAAKKHIMANDPKFSDIHMIKGDYAEKDINKITGKVRISEELAQGKFPKAKESYKSGITNIGHNLKVWGARVQAWGYRTFAAESKNGANEGMVREAVATDLMRLMGRAGGDSSYVTQEVNLIKAQYADGHPKLMLDIKFINREQTATEFGDQTLADDARYKDFDGSIVEGRLVNQKFNGATGQYEPVTDKIAIKKETGLPIAPEDVPRGDDGKPLVPPYKEGTQVEQLGRAKIKMLLLGDRDALGGTGANKGSVGKYMAAIDPGHSLEHGRMSHQINDDFSFEQPDESYHKKFKNFDIFDRAPLSEKMRGIKDIQDMHKAGLDEAVFDQYREEYGADNPGLDFREAIDQWKTDYQNKKAALIGTGDQAGVFTERLKVYDLNLSGDPATQEKRADQVFDLMDNLEKLTSTSDWRSDNGLVELERPRVTERVPWQVTQGGTGELQFSARATPEVLAKLQSFVGGEVRADDDGMVRIHVPPNRLDDALTQFSNDNVKDAVKQRVSPDAARHLLEAQGRVA